MKKTLLIALLFPLMCRAQDTTKFKFEPFEGIGTLGKPIKLPDTVKIVKPHRLAQLALLTTSVVTGALADGMNSRTLYTPGHLLASTSMLCLLAVPFTGKVDWKMPVSYVLIRYALWDVLYNVGALRKLNYIGGKNYYDEGANRVPTTVFNATKFVSFEIVLYLNVKK